MRGFMNTAGTLIVRETSRREHNSQLGGKPTDYAHVVALCPMRFRKEHTSTKRLDFVYWDGGAEDRPPYFL